MRWSNGFFINTAPQCWKDLEGKWFRVTRRVKRFLVQYHADELIYINCEDDSYFCRGYNDTKWHYMGHEYDAVFDIDWLEEVDAPDS